MCRNCNYFKEKIKRLKEKIFELKNRLEVQKLRTRNQYNNITQEFKDTMSLLTNHSNKWNKNLNGLKKLIETQE
jgi:hypothetical protein